MDVEKDYFEGRIFTREMIERCIGGDYTFIELERRKPEYDKKTQLKDPSFQLIEKNNYLSHNIQANNNIINHEDYIDILITAYKILYNV